MGIVRFDPFRGFEKVSRKMGDIVNELEKGINFEMGSFLPRVDITENDTQILVHAELPGISKENVKVSLSEDRTLTIQGEKKIDEAAKEKTYIRSERVYGSFTRSFILPDSIDLESISAKYENGVLLLTLAKIEPPKPKNIEINID